MFAFVFSNLCMSSKLGSNTWQLIKLVSLFFNSTDNYQNWSQSACQNFSQCYDHFIYLICLMSQNIFLLGLLLIIHDQFLSEIFCPILKSRQFFHITLPDFNFSGFASSVGCDSKKKRLQKKTSQVVKCQLNNSW